MPDDSEWLDGDLVRALELLADTFQTKSIPYALLGGLALSNSRLPKTGVI